MSQRKSLRAASSLGLGIALAITTLAGCKCSDDAPPPPLPATPPAPPPPAEEIKIGPEAQPVVDAGDDAGARKPSGQSLAKCCYALASNAELAPEPNKTYLKAAAATCSGAVAAGQSQSAVFAMVNAALKGVVSAPATCK